jgi:CBS domain-containing protein
MPVKDFSRREPRTIAPGESILEAAQQMSDRNVGCLVVVDENGCPVGMVTDRDIALAVAQRSVDAEGTAVQEIMNHPAVTVSSDAAVAVAVRFMREYSVRRILTVDGETGQLEGMLTLDDAVQLLASELSGVANLIRTQFPADLDGGHALSSGAGKE